MAILAQDIELLQFLLHAHSDLLKLPGAQYKISVTVKFHNQLGTSQVFAGHPQNSLAIIYEKKGLSGKEKGGTRAHDCAVQAQFDGQTS